MLVTLLTMIFVVGLMIAFTALYVAGEFAIVSARKSRIAHFANEGNRLAKMLMPIVEDSHKLDNFIAASQVGITLSSLILGIYGQQQIAPLLEPLLQRIPFLSPGVASGGIAALIVLIILTILQVVLGELVPKSIALRYPEETAFATALPMRWSADIILKPLIVLLNGSGILILRLLGVSHSEGHQHIHSPEEIQLLIGESHKGGLIDADDRRLLDNAFRVAELSAGEVAIPRTRMVAAPANSSVESCLKMAVQSEYTRIPVYETDIDHLVGFVHIKDLFRLHKTGQDGGIRSILRRAPHVPETMGANEVWDTLDRERSYVAFVFDEYGGTVGMITREDLIEELLGEVQDEFDIETPPIHNVSDHEYIVRGDVLISLINDELNLNLPTENANTVGGLMLHEIGRVPEVGDEVRIGAQRLRVESATRRTVQEVRLTILESNPPQEGEET